MIHDPVIHDGQILLPLGIFLLFFLLIFRRTDHDEENLSKGDDQPAFGTDSQESRSLPVYLFQV